MATEHKSLEPIFVPIDREQEYLESHRIRSKYLPNGIRLTSIWRSMDDAAAVDVRAFFDTGALNDPENKAGAHHLLEHLVASANEAQRAAKLGASFNGSTDWESYSFTLQGVGNPAVRNYGIWPFLSEFTRNLEYPLQHHLDREQATQTQKGIVLRELAKKNADDDFVKSRFKVQAIFAADNPLLFNFQKAGGTSEGLANIQVADLEELSRQIFIPQKTMVFVYTESPTRDSNNLITEPLEADFSEFPNTGKQSLGVDRSKETKLNRDYSPGNVYSLPSTEGKPVRTVELAWLKQAEDFSPEDISLKIFSGILSYEVHEYVRNNGISYDGGFGVSSFNQLRFCYIGFQARNEQIEEQVRTLIVPGVRKIIESLSSAELSEALEADILRREANPMPTISKIQMLIQGLTRYGRVIDIDRYLSIYSNLTVKDLQKWQEKLLTQDPTLFLL